MAANEAFGVDTNVVLTDGEVALEVVGCIKYMDEDGHVEFAAFRSANLSAPEGYGMLKMTEIALADELDTTVYMAMNLDHWTDDDDD